MLALSSLQTAVVDILYFLWVPTREHLVDEAIVVALIIARIEVFKPIPVLVKDLFEDIPVQRGLCSHQAVPSWGMEMCAVTLLYHVSPAQSTFLSACSEARSPTSLPCATGTAGQRQNANSYTIRLVRHAASLLTCWVGVSQVGREPEGSHPLGNNTLFQ